jgi:hypothetical protein
MLKLMRRIRRVRPVLPPPSAFTGFRFPWEVIVLAVRWYLLPVDRTTGRHADALRVLAAR